MFSLTIPSGGATVEALGTLVGDTNSSVVTNTYSVAPPAASPSFSPVAGTYTSAQTVTISTTSTGAVICWSTAGTPATNGASGCTTGTLYSSPVTVGASETLYAVAGGTGYSDSTVTPAAYIINTGPQVYYYLSDSLGTTRVMTDSSGNVCYDADFYPFGGERAYTNTCPQNYKFTGKERDPESNLDNFGARYDSSSLGRFMSPDPDNAGADVTNPQSWNMYSYVLNNPATFTDPTGMECVWDDGSFDSGGDPETGAVTSCQNAGGTWIELGENGNWSDQADSSLADAVDGIQNGEIGEATATDPAGGQYQTFYNSSGQVVADVTPSGATEYTYSQQTPWWSRLLNSPWTLSWIFPIYPLYGGAGVGPAGDFEYNPKTGAKCVGLGIGASGGHNVSVGPLTNGKMFNGQNYPNGADDILNGPSLSVGLNPVPLGGQVMVNGSGVAGGPTIGVPGVSVAVTYSVCF